MTPRAWVVYDQAGGLIHLFQAGRAAPVTVAARDWLAEYSSLLLQVTLILLVLSAVAGLMADDFSENCAILPKIFSYFFPSGCSLYI